MKIKFLPIFLGLICGMVGWFFGGVPVGGTIMKYSSGIGWFLVMMIILSTILLGYSVYFKKPLDVLTKRIAQQTLTKIESVILFILSLALVAAVCGAVT